MIILCSIYIFCFVVFTITITVFQYNKYWDNISFYRIDCYGYNSGKNDELKICNKKPKSETQIKGTRIFFELRDTNKNIFINLAWGNISAFISFICFTLIINWIMYLFNKSFMARLLYRILIVMKYLLYPIGLFLSFISIFIMVGYEALSDTNYVSTNDFSWNDVNNIQRIHNTPIDNNKYNLYASYMKCNIAFYIVLFLGYVFGFPVANTESLQYFCQCCCYNEYNSYKFCNGDTIYKFLPSCTSDIMCCLIAIPNNNECCNCCCSNENDETDETGETNKKETNKNENINNPLNKQNYPTIIISNEEQNEINDESLCIICKQNKKIYAVVPCGHLIFCESCREKYKSDECPICRSSIEKTLKIFV